MRSSAHIQGHPLHPMLIVFPFAFLFGSTCLDAWGRVSGRHRRWQQTARDMNGLGIASALVAAGPGLIDYLFAVPPNSSAKDRATKHMLVNLSALGLFAAARAARVEDDEQPLPGWALAAELAGAGLLSAGGWLGGTLVYRNQIAVDHRYADAGKWRETNIESHPVAGAVDVGPADELGPDQMKLVRIGSRRIVLARIEKGFAAFDDRCTHKGGPLSDGTLACDTVQCPWHGSQFNVTSGAVRHGPAREPIATYPVSVREGRVYIEAPAEERQAVRMTRQTAAPTLQASGGLRG